MIRDVFEELPAGGILTATSLSFGFWREDGDFQLLATLNNNDELISQEEFSELARRLSEKLNSLFDVDIYVLNREDAPDYLSIED